MSKLNITKVANIGVDNQGPSWLVKGLWLEQAVGIIGGEPKSFKTFSALSLAIAVATGKPCFGEFKVVQKGRVLVFAAEDSPESVRVRLEGMAQALATSLEELDIHLIVESRLQLDVKADQARLIEAIVRLQPALLVLDPLVRLHSIDENSSTEIAKLLSWIRTLQRDHGVAVALVHHARKRAGRERPGQSLRGSSELHAWGDSNLYIRRVTGEEDLVELTIEHRSAASDAGIRLQLIEGDAGPWLRYQGGRTPSSAPLAVPDRIIEHLKAHGPAGGEDLRRATKIKSTTFWSALKSLAEAGVVLRTEDRLYQINAPADTEDTTVASLPTQASEPIP